MPDCKILDLLCRDLGIGLSGSLSEECYKLDCSRYYVICQRDWEHKFRRMFSLLKLKLAQLRKYISTIFGSSPNLQNFIQIGPRPMTMSLCKKRKDGFPSAGTIYVFDSETRWLLIEDKKEDFISNQIFQHFLLVWSKEKSRVSRVFVDFVDKLDNLLREFPNQTWCDNFHRFVLSPIRRRAWSRMLHERYHTSTAIWTTRVCPTFAGWLIIWSSFLPQRRADNP